MLALKPGVRLTGIRPEMIIAVIAASALFEREGVDCIITSGIDGKHSVTSLHYTGAALDFRTKHVSREAANRISHHLRHALGRDFDVIHESTHIHVEYQPRQLCS